MPNAEETRHTIHIPLAEWRAAKAAVAMEGRTVSEVCREALRAYVQEHLNRTGR